MPLYAKSIDVQKIANNNKIGTEEAGRNARYEFFDEILEKTNSNKIAIAHNKNDKVETMIMNMLMEIFLLMNSVYLKLQFHHWLHIQIKVIRGHHLILSMLLLSRELLVLVKEHLKIAISKI